MIRSLSVAALVVVVVAEVGAVIFAGLVRGVVLIAADGDPLSAAGCVPMFSVAFSAEAAHKTRRV
jgi:hypothetical protein